MTVDSTTDIKPKTQKITLKVKCADSSEEPLILKVKESTTFMKIYNAVAEQRGVARTSFRLQFDGQNLVPNDSTPADMGMEEEECIDYLIEQVGGHSKQ
ncbi:ubiquitin-related domain-containing protein [Melampsora americana]|nr:ubiquitin-related domain-containing protein [Melampsora americana]